MTVEARVPHPHLERRRTEGAALIAHEHVGFNGWLAVLITKSVGSMWCAYAFAALAVISLPDAIHQGTVAVVSWISQTFRDAEAILELTDQIHHLTLANNKLTDEIHGLVSKPQALSAPA